MTLSEHPTEAFRRFIAAYPERDGGHDETAAREAWTRALGRTDAETLIAGAVAYAHAMDGRPRRYVMSARRWLDEGHWQRTATGQSARPAQVWVSCGSSEWTAWTKFRGKTPPLDRKGGWRFASRWPPAMDAAE